MRSWAPATPSTPTTTRSRRCSRSNGPSAAPPPRAPRTRRGRRHALTGWLFATPTALFVLLLFVLPLLLVLQMSASDWPLLAGNQVLNFPENYTEAVDNRF